MSPWLLLCVVTTSMGTPHHTCWPAHRDTCWHQTHEWVMRWAEWRRRNHLTNEQAIADCTEPTEDNLRAEAIITAGDLICYGPPLLEKHK